MPNDRLAAYLARVNRWNQTHPDAQDIDPQAAVAVARGEGLSGGIGDGGHAFGPHQMNNAGGVITGRFKGQTPEQINQWAWTPQGIDEALSGISHVAGGRRGGDAVNAIVRQYERPANPEKNVSLALAALGGSQVSKFGGGAASRSPSVAAAPATDSRQQFVQQFLGAIGTTGQLDNPSALIQALQTRRASNPGGSLSSPAPTTSPLPNPGGGIAELLREGTGGPTHSTGPHIHAAFNDPQAELAAIAYAQKLGLHVGENPFVGDTVDPVHAPNSYHGRNFPGLFGGKKLGQAIDVSGGDTSAFYKWLAGRR